jgi:hypothetical protein
MTSTTPWCLKCGWGDEKGALAPLYADRTPDAQPIAWAHQDCLKPEEEQEGVVWDEAAINQILEQSGERRGKRRGPKS